VSTKLSIEEGQRPAIYIAEKLDLALQKEDNSNLSLFVFDLVGLRRLRRYHLPAKHCRSSGGCRNGGARVLERPDTLPQRRLCLLQDRLCPLCVASTVLFSQLLVATIMQPHLCMKSRDYVILW